MEGNKEKGKVCIGRSHQKLAGSGEIGRIFGSGTLLKGSQYPRTKVERKREGVKVNEEKLRGNKIKASKKLEK